MIDKAKMSDALIDIIDICNATGNKHFLWFSRLLDSGIIAHAIYTISAGKNEDISQKIKTLRRHGCGCLDDDIFPETRGYELYGSHQKSAITQNKGDSLCVHPLRCSKR